MYLEQKINAGMGDVASFPAGGNCEADACANCAVRNEAVCGSLNISALNELHQIGRHRTLRKGQTLVWEGDDNLLVANVLEGMVKLSSGTSTGSEQILGIAGPGRFIGRPNGGASGHSIVALVDTKLCVFPTQSFRSFMDAHPELGIALLDKALDELDVARRWQLMLARASASERVASLLFHFAGRRPEKGQSYTFPLSRGQMADLAGLTIETVSRQLTRLKTSGVISLPSRERFTILEPDALAAIAGENSPGGLH